VPFAITSVLVLFYVVAPGNNDPNPNLYGAALDLMKYLFAMLCIAWFGLLALTRQRINRSPLFPLAALALSVAGVFSFIYSIAVEPGTTTYASALIPLIIIALPLVIPTRATITDAETAIKYLIHICGLASLFHVLWLVVNYATGMTEADPNNYNTIAFVSAPFGFMILSGLFRRNLLLASSIALIGASIIIRPSSTWGFTALFAAVVVVLYRLHYWRLVRITCVLAIGMLVVLNFAVFMSEDIAQALYSIEPLMKEDVLDAKSNNAFRLGIIHAARDELAEQSIWVGKFFSGNITVDARKYYPSPELEFAPIHSDFVAMLQQGGLIGYGLFGSLLMGIALLCAKAARLAHIAGHARCETLLDALLAINLTFMISITGNGLLQNQQASFPSLMLVALTIFLARDQPGFVGPIPRRRRKAGGPRAPGAAGLAT
jgi:hypothetical protein